MKYFAHTRPGDCDSDHWEELADHERRVAERCRAFVSRISPLLGAWGDVLGRWHDLGKYSNEFQSYLSNVGARTDDVHTAEVAGRIDHSTAAAQLAVELQPRYGRVLAYMFAGHHAGLPNWSGPGESGLKQRLEKSIPCWRCDAARPLLDLPVPPLPTFVKPDTRGPLDPNVLAAFRVAFWVRIMFSALVDADYLATESFMSPDRMRSRPAGDYSMSSLLRHFDRAVRRRYSTAEQTPVNQIRAEVNADCAKATSLPPGFFSLSVPTGGGKTLASLRFALGHAAAHGLDGIIVAIPFTSIIEQNAKIYRDLFLSLGDQIVLEHHSSLDPETETTTSRLQAENWDAAVVVTTNVQFFESLFANRTSRCRKLHRIARRVIILDEVQTLPVELLTPTLLALRELVDSYQCSVVLCTATQPAIEYRDDFPIGLRNIRPIIADPIRLHRKLKRADVQMTGKLTNDELVAKVDAESQVLCIVNTRPHAAEIFESLRQHAGNFHLSTRMCPAHRLHVLDERIKPLLEKRRPCRVISTQLIEAGVDLDFPVVYRAICGLDSLAQAAGRCNREGRIDHGRVYFFESERLPPPGMLRQAADSGRELLGRFDDLLSPEAVKAYFKLHYWKKSDSWDRHQVLEAHGRQPSLMQFDFREIAERYRIIREESDSILIPWREGKQLISKLDNPYGIPRREDWRAIQRFTVQVRRNELFQLQRAGAVELRHACWVLIQPHLYDESLGLRVQRADGVLPADDLIC